MRVRPGSVVQTKWLLENHARRAALNVALSPCLSINSGRFNNQGTVAFHVNLFLDYLLNYVTTCVFNRFPFLQLSKYILRDKYVCKDRDCPESLNSNPITLAGHQT